MENKINKVEIDVDFSNMNVFLEGVIFGVNNVKKEELPDVDAFSEKLTKELIKRIKINRNN